MSAATRIVLKMSSIKEEKPALRPGSPSTLSDQVVRRLHQLIADAPYHDGDKLPTNRELASELGVSILTVQKAMKNLEASGIVRCHRRRGTFLVQRDALENPRLRTGLVGMFCPQLFRDFHTEAMLQLEESLSQDGRLLSINFTHSRPEKEIMLLRALARQRLEGLVYFCSPLVAGSPAWSRRVSEWVDKYLNEGTAVIFVDLAPQGLEDRLISLDNEEAGYMLAMELVKRGHRKIAYVGTTHLDSGRGRHAGYLRALREHGLEAGDHLAINVKIIEGTQEALGIPQRVSALLDNEPGITGFVVDNQDSAESVRRVLQARPNLGLTPATSMVGMFEAESPPFEAVAWIGVPGKEMGRLAYEQLRNSNFMNAPGRISIQPRLLSARP